MEEISMKKNHGGGIMCRGIMKKESWKKNHGGGILEEESWRRIHGRGIIEERSWKGHLESIWEASEKHLGSIWASFVYFTKCV